MRPFYYYKKHPFLRKVNGMLKIQKIHACFITSNHRLKKAIQFWEVGVSWNVNWYAKNIWNWTSLPWSFYGKWKQNMQMLYLLQTFRRLHKITLYFSMKSYSCLFSGKQQFFGKIELNLKETKRSLSFIV